MQGWQWLPSLLLPAAGGSAGAAAVVLKQQCGASWLLPGSWAADACVFLAARALECGRGFQVISLAA